MIVGRFRGVSVFFPFKDIPSGNYQTSLCVRPVFFLSLRPTRFGSFVQLSTRGDRVDDLCCHLGVRPGICRNTEFRNQKSKKKAAQPFSEVLACVEMCEAAFKEHVKDTGCEVVDITMSNCLIRLVPTDLSADLQKMLHIVRYTDLKKYIIDQVGSRLCHDQKRQERHLEIMSPIFML